MLRHGEPAGLTYSLAAATTLSGAAAGNAVAVTPGPLTGWLNGVWTGAVSVNDYASTAVLTVALGAPLEHEVLEVGERLALGHHAPVLPREQLV